MTMPIFLLVQLIKLIIQRVIFTIHELSMNFMSSTRLNSFTTLVRMPPSNLSIFNCKAYIFISLYYFKQQRRTENYKCTTINSIVLKKV